LLDCHFAQIRPFPTASRVLLALGAMLFVIPALSIFNFEGLAG
jgi:hypothetical protein